VKGGLRDLEEYVYYNLESGRCCILLHVIFTVLPFQKHERNSYISGPLFQTDLRQGALKWSCASIKKYKRNGNTEMHDLFFYFMVIASDIVSYLRDQIDQTCQCWLLC
jgi:hypothetical protein